MLKLLMKLLGGSNEQKIKSIQGIIDHINALEPEFEQLSDEELKGKTTEFKEIIANRETSTDLKEDRKLEKEVLDKLLPEAFATVREAAKRVLNMRHFDVQLMGGYFLHNGQISEMRTGEGKTLVATLPAYLNALTGKGVHVITVNDYLAKRDSEWMGRVYKFLGLSVGVILAERSESDFEDKKQAYQCDITYGTNNEFGFDYLRDNMATSNDMLVQRPYNYAIIDEVDSILIDEARTPLIISGKLEKSADTYKLMAKIAPKLTKDVDYEVDEKNKNVILTEEGIDKAEKLIGCKDLFDISNQFAHHLLQALKAKELFIKDTDYVIKNGEVMIVDEFTGRLMEGRRWSDGLHQAVEAKEHVKIQDETQTLASITFQNLFRLYPKLSGMTGTAMTEEAEFGKIYNLEVTVIPTNKKDIRKNYPDVIYKTEKAKFNAVVEDIIAQHELGRPVLVGTISIEKSEYLSKLLKKRGIKHNVLNAKYHEKEAYIIAQAGRYGAVTIATNMAGRGTDILLGGNAEYLAKEMLDEKGILPETNIDYEEKKNEALAKARTITTDEHAKVVEAGGLHVIGTERHESRRIDNQLRGRSGRQGDPGFSQFFVSFEDDLMVRFGTDRFKSILEMAGLDSERNMRSKTITRSVETAQKRVEGNNFDARKHLLQYDDVMGKHREIMYARRNEILDKDDIHETVIYTIKDHIESLIRRHTDERGVITEENCNEIVEYVNENLIKNSNLKLSEILNKDILKIIEVIENKVINEYEDKIKDLPIEIRNDFEKAITLQVIDHYWMEHINTMDHLREGVSLRGYANEDPLQAYVREGFELFDNMLDRISKDTTLYLLKAEIRQNLEVKQVKGNTNSGADKTSKSRTIKKEKKVGRNDPCPCGSNKKYKQCCGK